MGHKYRKKNQHRKLMRRRSRAGKTWATVPLLSDRTVDVIRQAYVAAVFNRDITMPQGIFVGEHGPEAVRGDRAT